VRALHIDTCCHIHQYRTYTCRSPAGEPSRPRVRAESVRRRWRKLGMLLRKMDTAGGVRAAGRRTHTHAALDLTRLCYSCPQHDRRVRCLVRSSTPRAARAGMCIQTEQLASARIEAGGRTGDPRRVARYRGAGRCYRPWYAPARRWERRQRTAHPPLQATAAIDDRVCRAGPPVAPLPLPPTPLPPPT